jgi:transposase-like protein
VGRRGPKPVYDVERHPFLVRALAREGKTADVIAREIGVSRKTLYAWVEQYPEIGGALQGGRWLADAKVEDSLYSRATGYTYEDQEVRQVTTEDERPVESERGKQLGQTEKVTKTVRTVRRMKYHCPPDVAACIFWLKNRRPAQWREKVAEPKPEGAAGPHDVARRLAAQVLGDPEAYAAAELLARMMSPDAAEAAAPNATAPASGGT